MEGVSPQHFKQKFSADIDDVFGDTINRMISNGLLEISEGRIKLTHSGKLMGNEVFQAFLL